MGSIVVKNLGKAYKQYPSRWGRLIEWLLPDKKKPFHTRKWVLKDVSFEIMPGESVGIVGVNGAGKSTLLKMITGTTQPTTGSVEVQGRVAALLELGMGFHPDFTGRQNVIMAAQLQGLPMQEIQALMPEVEAFAAIGDYIDQPVRVYSSGMQMRLAFAVATAKRPDVLIVDEALSVGDAAFSRKCFQRIESFCKSGTTLLFVSHDVETVKKICTKAVYLKDGALHSFGEAKPVCDTYEQNLFGKKVLVQEKSKQKSAYFDKSLDVSSLERSYGGGGVEISEIRFSNLRGNVVNVLEAGSPFAVRYRVRFLKNSDGVKFGMMLKSVDGVCVYGVNSKGRVEKESFVSGESVDIQFDLQGNLSPGNYYLNVAVAERGIDGDFFLQRRVDCAIVRVVSGAGGDFAGCANLFAVVDLGGEKAS